MSKKAAVKKYLTLVNRRGKPHFRRLTYRESWYQKHGFVNPRKSRMATAQDEFVSLEEHDKQYHGGHYEDGQRCKLRATLEKKDEPDAKVSEATQGASNPYVSREMDAEYAEAFDAYEQAESDNDIDKIRYYDKLMKGMLLEYAKKAFAGTAVKDEDGSPKVVYHGTTKGGFTCFDTDGDRQGKTHDTGAWFCDSARTARSYSGNSRDDVRFSDRLSEKFMRDNEYLADGYAVVQADGEIDQSTICFDKDELKDVELDEGEHIEKVAVLDSDIWCKQAFPSVDEALEEAKKDAQTYFVDDLRSQNCLYSCYVKAMDMLEIDAHGDNWDSITTEWHVYRDEDGEFVDGFYSKEDAEEKAKQWGMEEGKGFTVEPMKQSSDEIVRDARLSGCGYDGVVLRNVDDPGPERCVYTDVSTDYVVFDSRNIKMADMVTFDDEGNLIPLSKRFDFTKDDVRY